MSLDLPAAQTVPQPLYCRELGAGARRVLALHCTLAHSGAWRGLAEAMGAEVTIRATDMLCHGRSPDWDGQGDFLDRMAAAALAHLDGPMDVVGHSFGASVALRLALARPDLVRSLTLIESVHFAMIRDEHPDLMAAQARSSAPFQAAVEAGDYETAARLFNGGWGDNGGRGWADLPEPMRAAMVRGVRIVPACSPAIIEDRLGLTRPGALDPLRMPVLLLRGGQTEPIIAAVNAAFARRIPGAENRAVDGAGHMLPVTHPTATAKELRRFFARSG